MVPRRAAGWWSETTRSSVNDDTENKNTMADINTIAEELGKLTVLEASELVKKLEEVLYIQSLMIYLQNFINRLCMF